MFQALTIMELPPDPNNNPHLKRQDEIFRSGFQPILPEDDDTPLGKRKASLIESRKAARIQSLAQRHARRTHTPEPDSKYLLHEVTVTAGVLEHHAPYDFHDMPGGDRMRINVQASRPGQGPYYGNRRTWGIDPARYDLYTGHTVTRPSSADLFKDQL